MLQLLVLLLQQQKGCCEMHWWWDSAKAFAILPHVAEESQELALCDTVEGCRHREEARTMVHDIFVTFPCPILPSARMALPYSNFGSGYNWGIMYSRQRRKVGVLRQCNTKQESIHHRAGLAAHNLWNTMHRRQVFLSFDNLRRHRLGADPHSPE